MAEDGHSTLGLSEVLTGEQQFIRNQRANRSQDQDADEYCGIAISGGGIRSASFALGVLQALFRHGLLKRFDYLSTVSGGGYIGSCWTWFNYLKSKGDIGESGYLFPFGRSDEGARSQQAQLVSRILGYIRQHASYLVPGHGINYVSAFAVVFRNMLLPSLVYLALAICLFTGLMQLDAWAVLPRRFELPFPINVTLMMALLSFGLVALFGLLFGPLSWGLKAGSVHAYQMRTAFQRWTGRFAQVGIVLLVIGLLPFFVHEVHHAIVSASSGVAGVLGGISQFLLRRKAQPFGALPTSIIANVSALLLILGFAGVGWYIAFRFPTTWLYALPLGLLFGWFVNINQFGLGRMYRDRLMETFLPDLQSVERGRWAPAYDATHTRLVDIASAESVGPYHILNTNLILSDDDEKKYRARGGDNFVLSPLFCGSDATGWISTERFDDGNLTLATAMATSGAAVNPDAGPNSAGLTKNPLVSFLMFVLGLRLGLYVGNPRRGKRFGRAAPNLINPGLLQGLISRNFFSGARYLALSDGGHFENTASYELIRRRLDLIVVSEAGQDENFSFDDVANLVEKVRVDFGVHIRFDPEFDLADMMPGSAQVPDDPMASRYGFAKRGFAVADIEYPACKLNGENLPAKSGKLVLVKATLVDGLPADIYGYRDANPSFPNQSTMDQFFDEPQFEAYRELGYQLGEEAAHYLLEHHRPHNGS